MKNFQMLRNDHQQQARHWQHHLCSNWSTITSITAIKAAKGHKNISYSHLNNDWICVSLSISKETCGNFASYLYLLWLSVSTYEFQHSVTFMIRKENMMLLCVTICDWCILQLVLMTFRMTEFLITCKLVLSTKLTSYSFFWS